MRLDVYVFMQGLEGAYNKYHIIVMNMYLKLILKKILLLNYSLHCTKKRWSMNMGERAVVSRFLYGYLEGFESVAQHSKAQEDGSAESFYTAVDTDILSQLSQQFFEKFNQAPAHPKYGVLQNKCVPEDLFDKDHQIENDKNLIFVRESLLCVRLLSV